MNEHDKGRIEAFFSQADEAGITNEEKARFFDRFKRFFGLAPQDGASQDDPLPFF